MCASCMLYMPVQHACWRRGLLGGLMRAAAAASSPAAVPVWLQLTAAIVVSRTPAVCEAMRPTFRASAAQVPAGLGPASASSAATNCSSHRAELTQQAAAMRLAGNPLIGAGSSSSSRPAVQCGRRPGSASRVCRVAAAKDSGSATAPAPTPPPKPVLNIIPQSQWANGVPPVMGAHLMASGTVAPVSTSTGAGEGVAQHTFQYAGEGEAQVVVYATAKNASAGLAKAVTEAAAAAIKAKGSFTLVLSGGSLLSMLSSIAESKGPDFSKWWVFFVDERNVPHDSPDSTYKGAQEALLARVGIPPAQVFAIQEGLPVAQAATNYEGRLLSLPADVLPRTDDAFPIFDLILLGVGPDGHVASLFPNAAATAATSGWVLPVTNSPKPPPERISFSMPAINAAKEVVVVAVGESKAEVVQRVLEVQALPGALPAQLVRPRSGKLKWVLDSMSAQELNLEEWASGKGFPRNV